MPQDRDNNWFNVPADNATYSGDDYNPTASGADPSQYDDLLKLSCRVGVRVSHFNADSGGLHIEDGVDLNRECESCVLEDGEVGAGRKGVAVTIKGGCRGITLRRLLVVTPGHGCDIEIGNWSDQSWRPCSNIVIEDALRADGKPVRVAWGRGKKPTIRGGNARIAWGRTLALHLYVYGKRWLPFLVK